MPSIKNMLFNMELFLSKTIGTVVGIYYSEVEFTIS